MSLSQISPDEEEIFFHDPAQLLSAYQALEESNLFYIQNAQVGTHQRHGTQKSLTGSVDNKGSCSSARCSISWRCTAVSEHAYAL